jgi:ribosomal protein L7/L12
MSTEEQRELYLLKSRINKLEKQVEFLYKHLGITFVEDTRSSDDPDVVNALRTGNVIEAIKVYRAKKGGGLAEAKMAVEEIQTRLGL